MINNEPHSTCRVFISHSSKDDEFCTTLAEDLRRELGENSVWYDNLRLRAGDRWWRIIVEELTFCDVFILIISPASMASDWVQREYDLAFRQKKRIIPLLYQDTKNIWSDLKDIHHISFTDPEKYEGTFKKLLQGLPVLKANNSYNMSEEDSLKKILDTIEVDFAAKNWEKLIDEVERLKKLKPEIVTSLMYYWQAKAFLALGHKPDAIEALEKAHAMESDEKRRLRILTELIPVLASLKQWAEVEKSTAMALKLAPDEPSLLSQRCDALVAILKVTKDRKQFLKLLYDLCALLALLGRWNDILPYSNEALRMVPGDPDFLTQRRDALLAILNNHKHPLELLREVCSTLAALEQWNDILKYTEDALRWVPNDRDFLTIRRDVLVRLLSGTHDQVQHLTFLRELCSVLIALGQWDDMLVYSEKALQLAPSDTHFLTQRRDVLERLLVDVHDQESQLKRQRELCLVLAALGQWEEVLHSTAKIRQVSPKDYEIIRLQNHARIQRGVLKVVVVYDRFSAWRRAWATYWRKFFQGLLSGLQQLLNLNWFIPATSILLVLLVISSLLVFLRPATTPSTPSSSLVIKIGVIVPGGNSKDNGLPIEQAVDLAIHDVHSHIANYALELVSEDEVPSGSISPDLVQAKKGMQNLINDVQVAGVVGPYESSIAKGIMPAANSARAPLALVSPSNTYSCLTKTISVEGCTQNNNLLSTVRPTKKVTYFRLATTDDYQGTAMADYLFHTLKLRTAYVIDDNEVYGIGLARSFAYEWQRLKGKVISYKSDANTSDYPSLVQAMTKDPPDVVFFAGRTDTGVEDFYQQIQFNSALQHTIYAGGSGLVSPPDLKQTIGGSITKPIYASFPYVDVDNLPSAEHFQTEFRQVEDAGNYGKYSAAGYDSANIFIQAIETAMHNGAQPPKNAGDIATAKTFRQAVIDAIQHISYNGVTGHISFDANGDTTDKALTINEFADGQDSWTCLQQIIINNPATVSWLNKQGALNGKACPISELKE